MKIIAYVANSYFYFGTQIPLLSKLCEVLTVPLFEILKNNLGDNTTPEEFALFWDSIMSADKYDVLWTYNRPDEITIAKCMEYGITIMIQEYFGHYPYNISGLIPLNCDFEKKYKEKIAAAANTGTVDSGKKDLVTITFSLSKSCYPESWAINNCLKKYKGRDDILDVYWHSNPYFEDNIGPVKMLMDVYSSSEEFENCRVLIRPHPRYPEYFADVIEYVEQLKNEKIQIDYSDVSESIEKTDISFCGNSNYGFDILRVGGESITFGGKAFYSHPQLTRSPKDPRELKIALLNAVRNIRENDKQLKSFLPFLLEDLKGPLANSCLAPYDVNNLLSAFEYGVSFPRLDI